MTYIPNTPEDQRHMLETLGLPNLESLLDPGARKRCACVVLSICQPLCLSQILNAC